MRFLPNNIVLPEVNMRKFLIVILLTIMSGCSTIPKETGLSNVWKDLQPYSKNFDVDSSDSKLRELFSNNSHRNASMLFVEELLRNDRLSFKDQFRLAVIVNALRRTAIDNEYYRICELINLGKRHKTYYAYVSGSIEPPFFLCTIEILKGPFYVAPLINPDGGQIVKEDIIPMLINDLKSETGEDFGHDYIKWKEWWLSKGQYLNYNKKLRVYK